MGDVMTVIIVINIFERPHRCCCGGGSSTTTTLPLKLYRKWT